MGSKSKSKEGEEQNSSDILMAFPTSCLCALPKRPSAYGVLPPVVGSRNGDRAATDLLKYGPGVAISVEKGTKRYYEM